MTPLTVREKLRERVLETIRSSGYQPSQLARGLRRNQTSMLVMIIPDVTNLSRFKNRVHLLQEPNRAFCKLVNIEQIVLSRTHTIWFPGLFHQ